MNAQLKELESRPYLTVAFNRRCDTVGQLLEGIHNFEIQRGRDIAEAEAAYEKHVSKNFLTRALSLFDRAIIAMTNLESFLVTEGLIDPVSYPKHYSDALRELIVEPTLKLKMRHVNLLNWAQKLPSA